MVVGIVARCKADQGSRLEMHRRDRVGDYASGRRTLYFRQRRLPRLGQSTVRSGRDDGLGRRLAQDAACFGTAVERRADRPTASTHSPPGVERRHRLALAALLRTGDTLTVHLELLRFKRSARLDRPRNHRPISRRFNTLRHPAAVNQTWNYCVRNTATQLPGNPPMPLARIGLGGIMHDLRKEHIYAALVLLRHSGPIGFCGTPLASFGGGSGLPVPRLAEDSEPIGLDGAGSV